MIKIINPKKINNKYTNNKQYLWIYMKVHWKSREKTNLKLKMKQMNILMQDARNRMQYILTIFNDNSNEEIVTSAYELNNIQNSK